MRLPMMTMMITLMLGASAPAHALELLPIGDVDSDGVVAYAGDVLVEHDEGQCTLSAAQWSDLEGAAAGGGDPFGFIHDMVKYVSDVGWAVNDCQLNVDVMHITCTGGTWRNGCCNRLKDSWYQKCQDRPTGRQTSPSLFLDFCQGPSRPAGVPPRAGNTQVRPRSGVTAYDTADPSGAGVHRMVLRDRGAGILDCLGAIDPVTNALAREPGSCFTTDVPPCPVAW